MLALVIFGFLVKAPAPQPEHFNNQQSGTSQTVQAIANEIKPQAQEPSPQLSTVAEEVEAPVTEPVVTHPVGCEHYRQLVAQYAWNVEVFMRICNAESGGNPYAVGDTYPINGLLAYSCGLYQVRELPGRPSCEELKDPATNIAWAYRIYQGQGLSAWSVCTNGKAQCY